MQNDRAHRPAADAALGVVGGLSFFELVALEEMDPFLAIGPATGLVAGLKVALDAPAILLWMKAKLRNVIGT
ncbi:hypothetical protein [Streptomyces xantholiticus]|uniref:hypothetical protein n=1 Tax=Streptomyces xantholiticus TaxID=68285 RepID=UPI0016782ED1|nr:hypothetical protein [Streptomyces xantholiticus]